MWPDKVAILLLQRGRNCPVFLQVSRAHPAPSLALCCETLWLQKRILCVEVAASYRRQVLVDNTSSRRSPGTHVYNPCAHMALSCSTAANEHFIKWFDCQWPSPVGVCPIYINIQIYGVMDVLFFMALCHVRKYASSGWGHIIFNRILSADDCWCQWWF